MHRLFFIIITLCFFCKSYGQKNKSIELSLIGRHDIHGNYVSNYAGRAYNDTNKISGLSYGVGMCFLERKFINHIL